MNEIKIEWYNRKAWHSIRLPIGFNKTGYYYTYNSKNSILIWKDFEKDTPVLSKNTKNEQWKQVGRIAQYKHIFLGEGKSFTEHLDEKHKNNMQGYLKELLPNIEV